MEALLSFFLSTAPVQRVTIQFVKQSRNVMRQLLSREMFWMYPAHKGPIPKLLTHILDIALHCGAWHSRLQRWKVVADRSMSIQRVRRAFQGWIGMEGGFTPISCVYFGHLLLLLAASHTHSLFPSLPLFSRYSQLCGEAFDEFLGFFFLPRGLSFTDMGILRSVPRRDTTVLPANTISWGDFENTGGLMGSFRWVLLEPQLLCVTAKHG